MDNVLIQLVSGLMRGSYLFLVTVGLTLIYGLMSVLNVAHVSFYALGAYFTISFWKILQAYKFSYWVAIPLACAVMALIGLIIELVIMRHLYKRIQSEMLLATFALIFVFRDVVKLIWGGTTYSLIKPSILNKPVATIGVVSFPASVVFTISVALIIGVGLWFWLQKSKFGRTVRATQSDPEMVSALGIPVPLIYSSIFALSALLAGLAGAVWVSTGIVQPGRLDIPILPQIFCVMVIGGLGSFLGTAVAALIVGEVFALSILVAPKAGMITIYLVTGIILAIRPWGLFGTKGRIE